MPKDWDVNDKQGVYSGSFGEAVFGPRGKISVQSGLYVPALAITTATNNVPYKTKDEFDSMLGKPVTSGTGQRLYKTGNIKVDGIDAVQFVSRALPEEASEGWYAVITWVNINGLNYYFEFGPDEKDVTDNINIYNQILSTFHFN